MMEPVPSMQNAYGLVSGFGRCLVTACLNINSLLAHIDELRAFVSQSNDIDILAIIKTKLDSDYS